MFLSVIHVIILEENPVTQMGTMFYFGGFIYLFIHLFI